MEITVAVIPVFSDLIHLMMPPPKKPKLVVYDVLNGHINRIMIDSIFLYFPLIFKKV